MSESYKSLKGYLLARLSGMLKLFHESSYSTEFKNYNTKLAAFKKKAAALNKGLCNALNFFIAQMECGAQNFYIVGIANDVFKMFFIFFCVLLECRSIKNSFLYQICSLYSQTAFYFTAGAKVMW